MRLNIFRIPRAQYGPLRSALQSRGLEATSYILQDGWRGEFLFHHDPPPGEIPWVQTFAKYIGGNQYFNKSFHGAIILKKANSCYAIAFGKSHFYIRPFCDYDFGVELAKRIADESDVSQTAAKRYQGRQRKDIRSFTAMSRLAIPPGSSIEFLQGSILGVHQKRFGKKAKFGTSALLEPDINPSQIGRLLTSIETELKQKPLFKLPRTVILTDEAEIERYDKALIEELRSPVGLSEISTESFDLFGVDFIFSSSGAYEIKSGSRKSAKFDRLTIREVKEYLEQRKIPDNQVLATRIIHHREGGVSYSQRIKEAIDYISEDENVALQAGKWLKFNEDYLEALNAAVDAIEVEPTESALVETSLVESEFNESLIDHGYTNADKDFTILRVKKGPLVEAWDLQRGDTVYAVKFGSAQKLGYVVDQASNVLELIHSGKDTESLPPFRNYCIWLGYRAHKIPTSISQSGSLILKQKIEAWARRCEEVGFTPKVKLSRSYKPPHDSPVTEIRGFSA